MDRLKRLFGIFEGPRSSSGQTTSSSSQPYVRQHNTDNVDTEAQSNSSPSRTASAPAALNEADETSVLGSLSWENRIYGFVFFLCLGIVISFMGSACLYIGKVNSFALLTSLGSLVSMASTCFLMGPLRQMRQMFAPTRLIATVIYLFAIVLTIVAGVVLKIKLLALILVGVQYAAMIWYSLSYIPYARELCTKCICACFT